MKLRYRTGLLALGMALALGSCDDSETLTPSDIPEYSLALPQGDADYDRYIRDFYDRTGVYILYDFKPAEVYFNLNSDWAEAYSDTTVTRKYYALEEVYDEFWGTYKFPDDMHEYDLGYNTEAPYDWWVNISETGDNRVLFEKFTVTYAGEITVQKAEKEYIARQLALLRELFLDGFYSDNVLRQYLPLKILLGSHLEETVSTFEFVGLEAIPYYTIFNNLLFAYGDESIEDLTAKQKDTLKINLNCWFIDRFKDDLSFEEFFAVSTYEWAGKENYEFADYYALGLVATPTWGSTSSLDKCQKDDLEAYMELIISTPYEELTVEGEGEFVASCPLGDECGGLFCERFFEHTGCLNYGQQCQGDACEFKFFHTVGEYKEPGVLNQNELIRKKYDILIKIFKDAGVDLQAIGDKLMTDGR